MRILAFDQSTQKTGWAVFDDGQLVESGVCDLHKEKDVNVRLQALWQYAIDLVQRWEPNLVVAENVSLQNPNVKTIVELARVQGLLQAAAYSLPVAEPVTYYMPATWRKAVGIQTGRGIKRADLKKAAIAMVSEQYHKQVSDDEADAILIGQAAVSLATEAKEK